MSDWVRVSKREPCRVCGHDSFCSWNDRIGLILCMRIESPRPSKNAMGGWLHPLGERRAPVRERKPEPEPPAIDAAAIMRRLWHETTNAMRAELAKRLGVTALALHDLGASWCKASHAWAFPMFNGLRQVVGIRLRNEAGDKWAVKGSHQGIFWPAREPNCTVYLVEGPTDCAAALSLDLFALGRPCCQGCVVPVQVAINRLGAKRAVLIADNDGPGINGAAKLADELQVPCARLLLPTKDLRQFLNLGGTAAFIESQLHLAVWQQPRQSHD
jgi:hypothetical protein